MGMEHRKRLMVNTMKANFMTLIFMAQGHAHIRMEVFILENGEWLKNMEREFSHGLMGKNMMDILKMTAIMEKVFFIIPMVVELKENGKNIRSKVY